MVKISRLEKVDLGVIGAGLLVALFAGAATQLGLNIPGLQLLFNLILPAGLLSVILIVMTARLWGGQVRRYLTIIGIGLSIFLIETFPHLSWHRSGAGPLVGLNGSFWYIFFHGGIAVSFAIIAYGFYLFYHSADGPV